MRGSCFITIYSLFLLVSCNYKKIKDLDAYNAQTSGKFSTPITGDLKLSFPTMKEYVFKSCLTCHVGKNKPEFGSADLIRQEIQKIASEVNSNAMPPPEEGYSPLTDCQKAMLEEWIKQNTPDDSEVMVADLAACKDLPNQKDKKPEVPIEQMPLTYSTLLERILKPRCITCHNSENTTEAAEILFYPYEAILKDNRFRWKAPGVQSRIYKVLTRDDEERMPPPEDSGPLSEAEVQFIVKWIDAGKPQ
jgi:hypothetical protein